MTYSATFLHASGQLLRQGVAWCFATQDRSIESGELVLVAGIVLLIYLLPRAFKKWLRRAQSRVCSLYVSHKAASIVALGLLPAAARFALLPAIAIPIPVVPDEFSHLLLADTIASGRLTNPPHPLASHFEAAYVLQYPTYASVYPPAHGIVMGFAQLLGFHPWAGVLAEVSLMTMAIAWMLDAWFPPRWVLLGTMVAVLRLGIWMTSYWGGSLAVIGGALVIGALKRIWDAPSARQGVTLGFGMLLLANTRPYEGLLSGLVAIGLLGMLLLRPAAPVRRRIFGMLLLPLAACLAAGGACMTYYNWRVTGDPLLLPYVADQRASGVPQSFIFRPPVPPPSKLAHFKDLADNYTWQLAVYRSAKDPSQFWAILGSKLATFWHFYLHPLLLLPLLALPWTLRDVRMRVLLFAALFVSIGMALYPFYFAHYSAPLAGIVIILLVQGVRHISVLSRRRSGGGLTIVPLTTLILGCITVALLLLALVFRDAVRVRQRSLWPAASLMRDEMEKRCAASSDKQHLVIVRYGPNHDFHHGMTYNRADIDRARVVWARELDPAANSKLLNYYAGRTVWLFEPDATPPLISPYLPVPSQAAGVRLPSKPDADQERR